MIKLIMNYKFKCDRCEKVFPTIKSARLHVKFVHDKIQDFACNQCIYKCTTNGKLKQHIKLVHDKIKDFKCNLCDFAFSENFTLQRHIKSAHDKIQDFGCNLCIYKCSTNCDLTKHIKQVHRKIKNFECNQCNFTCYLKGDFTSHIKNVHLRPVESKRMSLGEFKVHTILKKFSIPFTQEKKFDDLISDKGKHLRFDFAIQNNDSFVLIEFDGSQHFKKVRWSNENSEQQIHDQFEYLKKCDKQKNDYCRINGYPLLRIRYDDKNVENMILDFLVQYYDIDMWIPKEPIIIITDN